MTKELVEMVQYSDNCYSLQQSWACKGRENSCQLLGLVADHRSGSQQPLQSSLATLKNLSQASRLHPDRINAKAALMQALAECKEDYRPDNSAVERNSNDKFIV